MEGIYVKLKKIAVYMYENLYIKCVANGKGTKSCCYGNTENISWINNFLKNVVCIVLSDVF